MCNNTESHRKRSLPKIEQFPKFYFDWYNTSVTLNQVSVAYISNVSSPYYKNFVSLDLQINYPALQAHLDTQAKFSRSFPLNHSYCIFTGQEWSKSGCHVPCPWSIPIDIISKIQLQWMRWPMQLIMSRLW